jgi:hypothetical protein
MPKHPFRLIQGIEWVPCCIGVGFNLYRAYQEDKRGKAPADLTHAQQGEYMLYGIYQLGTFIGTLKGLEQLLR